jgi:hypothetical protein
VYKRFLKAKERLSEIADKLNLDVLQSPIADFDVEKYFEGMDNRLIKESVIAGCDPDRDAIDSNYSSPIRDLTRWKKRGAGGHIHVSLEDYPHLHDHIVPAIRLMAIFAGNTFIANVSNPEEERERMEVFGKPGRYRVQRYGKKPGMEYRTLSNSWLLSELIVDNMQEACEKAVELLRQPKLALSVISNYLEDTVDSITNVKPVLATEILKSVYKEA